MEKTALTLSEIGSVIMHYKNVFNNNIILYNARAFI